ncbi:MAG: HDOD domain-containing protein [Pseudomonadota bacterium]
MAESATAMDPSLRLREAVADGSLNLPVLPSVAADVLALSQSEDGDAAGLAGLIQTDPALASNVLRIVNTPAFRGAAEIVALQQAIARLGMGRIREIALSIAVKSALTQPGPYGALVQEAWQDALATGLWAREVARACRKNVENAYLCGLLHNIGVPVALHGLTAICEDGAVEPPSAEPALSLAVDMLRPAGVALVERWKLPALVATFIAHEGPYDSAGEHADLIATVDLGISLAGAMKHGPIEPDRVQEDAAVAWLHLYPDDMQGLLALETSVTDQLRDLNA